jgi:hypothetical protein
VTTEADQSRRLLVVLDPEFGERVREVKPLQPVWVVESARNTAVVKAAWAMEPADLTDVTLFRPTEVEPEQEFVSQLDMIDLHHGQVIGARLTSGAEAALRQLGFVSFQSTPEGFAATRSKAEAERLRRDAE